MDARSFEYILNSQQEILQDIAFNVALPQTLSDICRLLEALFEDPHAKASILLLRDQHLFTGAAPSLPSAYNDHIDGARIGPEAGSCGTACYRNQQVIVENIASDPLWKEYKDLALSYGLKACWSVPIRSSDDKVLGSFAVYYEQCQRPSPFHLRLIKRFSAIASVALERCYAAERERQLLNQVREAHNRLHSFAQVMSELAFVLDEDGSYVDVFGNTDNLYRFVDPNALIGQKVEDILPPTLAEQVLTVIHTVIADQQLQTLEYSMDTTDGSHYFEGRVAPIDGYLKEQPNRPHVVWTAVDITKRKHAEQEVERLAFYDDLTGLPNRRLLLDRLDEALKKAHRQHSFGAIIYLDVDDFKPVNDRFGHSHGDHFLRQLAERLVDTVRETDTVARMGGDEFILLLDDYHYNAKVMEQVAEGIAAKLSAHLSEPFLIGGQAHYTTVSMGICLFDETTHSHERVLRSADQAMYRSKKESGSHYTFYDTLPITPTLAPSER